MIKCLNALVADDDNVRHLVELGNNAEAPATSEFLSRLCDDDFVDMDVQVKLSAELVSKMTDYLNLQSDDYENRLKPCYTCVRGDES